MFRVPLLYMPGGTHVWLWSCNAYAEQAWGRDPTKNTIYMSVTHSDAETAEDPLLLFQKHNHHQGVDDMLPQAVSFTQWLLHDAQ